jgi:protein TonB
VAPRTYLFAISLGAHVALGVALAALPARVRHEIIAISMAETKKPPKPIVHEETPPEPPKPAAHPVRAKVAPPVPKAAEAPPPSDEAAPAGDAVPDFGIALSNGGGGGLAVPAARAASPQPATTATAKTLGHASHAPIDECTEPPAKPKLLARPTPAYTEDARAAGISGKVRVEITVDAQGRVVSVRVLQGLGHGLDEAALAAARAMTFEPAIRCGKAASATFKVGFNFAPGTP